MLATSVDVTDLVPSPINEPLPSRRRLGLTPLFLLAAILAIDFFAYERVQPLATGVRVAAWVPSLAMLAVGAAGLAFLARYPSETKRFIPIVRVAIVLATLLGAGSLTWLNWDVPTYLQYPPSATATMQAKASLQLATPFGNCTVVRHTSTDLLPTPYQQCVESWAPGFGPRNQVEYLVNWGQSLNTPSVYGFAYSPGSVPNSPDSCIRHVGGAWWDILGMDSNDPANPCPSSFQFRGGG